MAEVGLDLYFSPQLPLHFRLLQLGFEKNLHNFDLLAPINNLRREMTRPQCVYSLWQTFSATMYLVLRSRARYTFPNFPFPSDLPMSKSHNFHRRPLCFSPAAWLTLDSTLGASTLARLFTCRCQVRFRPAVTGPLGNAARRWLKDK